MFHKEGSELLPLITHPYPDNLAFVKIPVFGGEALSLDFLPDTEAVEQVGRRQNKFAFTRKYWSAHRKVHRRTCKLPALGDVA